MNAQGEKEGLMIRIAVCDDQEIVCENVRKMILNEEEDRYEVDLFRSGKELLEAGRKYDILFLDIDMPGMDGIMTAKEIRKTDKQVEIINIANYGGYATCSNRSKKRKLNGSLRKRWNTCRRKNRSRLWIF